MYAISMKKRVEHLLEDRPFLINDIRNLYATVIEEMCEQRGIDTMYITAHQLLSMMRKEDWFPNPSTIARVRPFIGQQNTKLRRPNNRNEKYLTKGAKSK